MMQLYKQMGGTNGTIGGKGVIIDGVPDMTWVSSVIRDVLNPMLRNNWICSIENRLQSVRIFPIPD